MHILRLFVLSVLLVALSACRVTSSPPPTAVQISDFPTEIAPEAGISMDPFEVDLTDMEVFKPGLIEDMHPILVEHADKTIYRMDWTISPDLEQLEGEMMIRYTNHEDVALDSFFLRLYPNISSGEMSVSNLTIDGIPVNGSLEKADHILRLPLSNPVEPGQEVEIGGSFSVQLPLEMSGNYGLFGSFDGLLLLQEAYPIIPVYDDNGWDIDLPAPHGDLTHLDTSYYVVRVSLPADLTVIASGFTLEHKSQDDEQTVTYLAGPARDFYFAAGDFQKASTRYDETVINSYVLPAGEPSSEASLLYAKAAIAILNERLGKYPYTEFDMISTPMLALGIEYPGIVALNVNMYDPKAEISGQAGTFFLESVIAHEVAHQWYYNLVGNDQLDEPWLDEAIVQYLTGIYYLDAYGENGYQGYRRSWLDRLHRVEEQEMPIGLPAENYEGVQYGAIVYGRGPLFVEALADEMGQDAFWEFLSSFTETHHWQIAQPTTFIEMAETTCACDLSQLWETWGVAP